MADKNDVMERMRDLNKAIDELPDNASRTALRAELNDLHEFVDTTLSTEDGNPLVRPRAMFSPDNGTSNCCNSRLK